MNPENGLWTRGRVTLIGDAAFCVSLLAGQGSALAMVAAYILAGDLCREYGISRPTAYRWINRYNETGPEGLVDRSRRPHTCSHATLEPMETLFSYFVPSISLGAHAN
jgi:hypothetical protein